MTKGEYIADLGGAVTRIEQLVKKMGGTVSFHFDIETAMPQFHNYLEIKLEIGFDPPALREFLEKGTTASEAKV
jgi:hypothetical protein